MNRKGFTLVEVMVSIGLTAAFVVLAGGIARDIYLLTEKDRSQLDAETDLTFAMRYLGGVVKDAGPSFNNIKNNLDDNGYEFFDQLYDVSTAVWKDDDPEKSRTLTLDPKKGRLHFYFLTNSPDQVDPLFYNPGDAYLMPEPDIEMNVSSPLSFQGINYQSAVSKYMPDIWKENNLILMKVPVPLRYVPIVGQINLYSAPREHYFLGTVKGINLVQDRFADGGQDHAYSTHPVDNSSVPTADVFLRTVPPVGGASPVIETIAVKGYRVSLVPRGKSYDLYSYQYVNGTFAMPFMIAANVKTVTFRREEVSLPLITVRVSVEKKTVSSQ